RLRRRVEAETGAREELPAGAAREPRLGGARHPRTDARGRRAIGREPAIGAPAREARARADRRRTAERVLGPERRAADHGRCVRAGALDIHGGARLGPEALAAHHAADLQVELVTELVREAQAEVGLLPRVPRACELER